MCRLVERIVLTRGSQTGEAFRVRDRHERRNARPTAVFGGTVREAVSSFWQKTVFS